MAYQQNLKPRESAPRTPHACDRAVFTSLPSALGEGYRIVAASTGLRTDERSEITRRSPSHDSLCGRSGDSAALAVYKLASGRSCVSASRYEGAEHTQRGGGRVWTDVVVLDSTLLSRLGGHPDCVRDALVLEPPARKNGASLAPLHLEPPSALSPERRLVPKRRWDGNILACLAAALHGRTQIIAAVGKTSSDALSCALHMVPAVSRTSLQYSAGLRYSRMRQVTCTIVEELDQETLRATRGHAVTCLEEDKLRRGATGPLRPWFALMARWWDEGRVSEIQRLSAAMRAGWAPQDMLDVAAVCEAIDRHEIEAQVLENLLAKRAAA